MIQVITILVQVGRARQTNTVSPFKVLILPILVHRHLVQFRTVLVLSNSVMVMVTLLVQLVAINRTCSTTMGVVMVATSSSMSTTICTYCFCDAENSMK